MPSSSPLQNPHQSQSSGLGAAGQRAPLLPHSSAPAPSGLHLQMQGGQPLGNDLALNPRLSKDPAMKTWREAAREERETPGKLGQGSQGGRRSSKKNRCKTKKINWISSQLKTNASEATIKRAKTTHEWKEILANHTSGKELISRLCKGFRQPNTKDFPGGPVV